jgi:Carboxypeptidase regulatory-like domain
MRYPVEIDPSFPRVRLLGTVHCASTGLPLASAEIRVQGYKHVLDRFFGINRLGATDRRGRFNFADIPVGTYYAYASLPGYVSGASLLPKYECFGVPKHFSAPVEAVDAALPKITINAEETTDVDLQLEVGGSISGSVVWQDGTHAKGNWTKLMLVDAEDKRYNHGCLIEETCFAGDAVVSPADSDGNFRFGCLPPGRYIIGAKVPRLLDYLCKNAYPGREPAMVRCASLYYWSGGKAYYKEAVPFELKSRENIEGINIVLPMLEQGP